MSVRNYSDHHSTLLTYTLGKDKFEEYFEEFETSYHPLKVKDKFPPTCNMYRKRLYEPCDDTDCINEVWCYCDAARKELVKVFIFSFFTMF